jgi:RimJ/RimL family protein N-acetyltransferase
MATIKTPRLLLRHWEDADIEPWVAMNLDPRVTEFFAWSFSREIAVERAEQRRRELDQPGHGWWVVEAPGVTSFAGIVTLNEVAMEAHFTPAWEIGWRFARQFWHRGYATESARGVIDFAFNTLGLKEVVALTAVTNVRSQRVMQRLGMTCDRADDFDHPKVDKGHPLERHVLYRISAPVTEEVRS